VLRKTGSVNVSMAACSIVKHTIPLLGCTARVAPDAPPSDVGCCLGLHVLQTSITPRIFHGEEWHGFNNVPYPGFSPLLFRGWPAPPTPTPPPTKPPAQSVFRAKSKPDSYPCPREELHVPRYIAHRVALMMGFGTENEGFGLDNEGFATDDEGSGAEDGPLGRIPRAFARMVSLRRGC
jgi:hypothetical protein